MCVCVCTGAVDNIVLVDRAAAALDPDRVRVAVAVIIVWVNGSEVVERHHKVVAVHAVVDRIAHLIHSVTDREKSLYPTTGR